MESMKGQKRMKHLIAPYFKRFVLRSPVCAVWMLICLSGCKSGQDNAGELPVNLWQDMTGETIGITDYWTNRVDIADLNGDGLPDLLFATGGTNHEPLDPELSRIYFNQGPGEMFTDSSESVFVKNGGFQGSSRREILTVTGIPTLS